MRTHAPVDGVGAGVVGVVELVALEAAVEVRREVAHLGQLPEVGLVPHRRRREVVQVLTEAETTESSQSRVLNFPISRFYAGKFLFSHFQYSYTRSSRKPIVRSY